MVSSASKTGFVFPAAITASLCARELREELARKGHRRRIGGLTFEVTAGGFGFVNRRDMARDFERYRRIVAIFIHLAMIRIMLRRLTKPCHST